ncbi:SpoIIE family protein phosphatase [bacterium]|nr:SpoIIE family protein phosphatase [bacterium]
MNRLLRVYLILFGIVAITGILGWSWLDWIQVPATIGFVALTLYYAFRLTRRIFRKFLWRIRRKLILSYIFIGFIPILLLVVLTLLGFFIFMGQTTSEMFSSNLDGYLLRTKNQSEKLLHLTEFLGNDEGIDRWFAELKPEDKVWLSKAEVWLSVNGHTEVLQGDGSYDLPEWAVQKDFTGLVIRDGNPTLAAVHIDPDKTRVIQVLVPVNSRLLDVMSGHVDADIRYLRFSDESAKSEFNETIKSSTNQPIWPTWWDFPIWWLSFPDQVDWKTGEKMSVLDDDKKGKHLMKDEETGAIVLDAPSSSSKASMGAFVVSTHFSRVYRHIFSRSSTLQKFVYGLMFTVAIFFLIIELISVLSGFLLAKSITASVHNLFEGTERIKKGDFNYQIKVESPDQLGDLAHSFNSMTDSVKNLLKVQVEKERLSESLRIARQMQENLLPREIHSLGDIEISAMNIPAQEVCGDYYDILQQSEQQVGIIIADVSGKGPSAALYMAEVKGVILSLSQRTVMPRQLLMEANNILGPTLDSKNFITMTYAIFDEKNRTMKMSRAGHNPILHFTAPTGLVDVVQPAGIGLGLTRNGIFDRTLEEVERKLNSGDILVFYTDGLTEAMNSSNQLYGLSRLSQILLQNKDLGAEEIKSAIFRDLQFFLQNSAPQDDITLVLLKVR